MSLLTGMVVIAGLLFLFYITGKISSKYLTTHDDKDYIAHGFAIWVVIFFVSGFCYAVGKVILHFI